MRIIISFICFIFCSICSLKAQDIPFSEWIKKLTDDSKSQVLIAASVYDSIEQKDTNQIKDLVQELEKRTVSEEKRLQTRVKSLKSKLFFYKLGPGDSLYAAMMKDALSDAYSLNDPYMIAEFSRWYGEMLNSTGNRPLAAQYCLNSIKLQEELGFQYFPEVKNFHLTVGEMLFHTINFRDAISYYSKAIKIDGDLKFSKEYLAQSLNTLARCFYQMKQYDSSVFYYEMCMKFVKKNQLKEDIYYAASDNRFDPFLGLKMYDSCKVIADNLYAAGKNPPDSMALIAACYMYARIAIMNNNFTEGLKWGLQSEQYGKNFDKRLLLRMYKDIAYCYEKTGQADKALFYSKKNSGTTG
jgi:tetratricopeptide (TPR) repeat protein